MAELRKYFDRLQNKLGETKSADKIIEGPWWEVVVRELNKMSFEYEEAPPTRILALSLILSYWLGWLDASKTHYLDREPVAAWRRIGEAYKKGIADYP
jgi:hypothetical protein